MQTGILPAPDLGTGHTDEDLEDILTHKRKAERTRSRTLRNRYPRRQGSLKEATPHQHLLLLIPLKDFRVRFWWFQ